MPYDFPEKKSDVVPGPGGKPDAPFLRNPFTASRTLIEALALHPPSHIALTAPGRDPLTYEQLRNQVRKIGAQLQSLGAGAQDRVAIVLPNGPEMAVSFLAVSSVATAAPLNPAYRPQEFDFFLKDLQATFLIVQTGWESPVRAVAHAHGIPIIELAPTSDAETGIFSLSGKGRSPRSQRIDGRPDDVALVLHTSGTTARPKLIPLTQTNLFLSAMNVGATLQLRDTDRCLNIMPLFHIHGLVGALLASLTSGGSLICTPGFHAPDFFDWLETFQPTWYTGVPTMHQSILARVKQHPEKAARSSLRLIRSSSAPLPSPVLRELEAIFHCPVIEAYGMTEAAHQMASNPLPPGARKPGSVGVAAGPQVTILDEAGNVLSPGTQGEVAVRGPNVMIGYDHNPVANQETFINGWFRTGDQGYLDSDGYLFLTGRIKEIINRGGEKIAPREVDDVLLEHPAVAQAVTFAMPHSTLGEDVAAAVVLCEGTVVTPQDLQKHVSERLADFKIPRKVIIVQDIPKGPTGKLQRIGLDEKLGLTEMNHEAEDTTRHDPPPQTWIEKKLLEVWTEVLRMPHVGLHDDFLKLGGDSILATQILTRVREVMQVDLSFVTFFESSTPAAMAQNIEKAKQQGTTEKDWHSKSVVTPSNTPLTSSQARLWYLDQLTPGDVAYNRPTHFRLAGSLNYEVLERTINEILRRHEALRTIFQSIEGEPFQVVVPEVSLSLPIIDIPKSSSVDQWAEIEKLVNEESRQGFHLGEGPLVRGRLVRLDDDDHLLFLTFHHIVFDGWSEVILLQEMAKLYEAFSHSLSSPLPDLAIQYKDYAVSQFQDFKNPSFEMSLQYWKMKLADPTLLNVPTDHPRLQHTSFSSGRELLPLSRALSDGIRDLGSREGASIFMVVLAAFQSLLNCYTNQEDVSVGTLVANRTQKETEELIGYFVNNLVLRTDLSGNPRFQEILQRVRKGATEAYSHQEVPFEMVLQAVHPKRDPLRPPLFQVMVVAHNYPKMLKELPNLTISRFSIPALLPTQYELTLFLEDDNECLACDLTYRTDLFDKETITSMLEQFHALLHYVTDNPAIRLGTLANALHGEKSKFIGKDSIRSSEPWKSRQVYAENDLGQGDNDEKTVSGPMGSKSQSNAKARDTLSETKRVLLEKRLRGEKPIGSSAANPTNTHDEAISSSYQISIARITNRGRLPLSFAQQRLWYLDQLQPGSSHYNIHSAYRLNGFLNMEAFQLALNALVARHEVLRSRVESVDGVPIQKIVPFTKVPVTIIDLSQIPPDERDDEIQRLAIQEAQQPFDIQRDFLLRVTLIRESNERHILLLTIHHIVADGWSIGVLHQELSSLYDGYSSGAVPALPELPIQYGDFAVWQRAYLQGEVLERELNYWRDKLAEPPRFELLTDHLRPVNKTYSGSQDTLVIPPALTRSLKYLGKTEQATPFMVWLAVFQILLSRYIGLSDVIIGTPVAGRNITDIEPLIGYFVNTLVLRTDLSGNPSFREVVNRTRQTCLEAYNHQVLPLEKLVEELDIERDPGRNPIFQIMFVLQNAGGKPLALSGLAVESLSKNRETAKFDLTLSVREAQGQFLATFIYNTDLFEGTTIQRMLGHFLKLSEGVVENPDRRMTALPMLTENEQEQILREWNDTKVNFPNDHTIHELFKQQVENFPNAIAVKFNNHQLTYAELNYRANQVAHYLKSIGVRPEWRIGVCLERSPEAFVSILGILKAGGTYVPLDPAFPQMRQDFILHDSQLALLITQKNHLRDAFDRGIKVVNLDTESEAISQQSPENLQTEVLNDHLAYIMYTSGSTGRPKGTMVSHRNLINAYWAWEKVYRLRHTCTVHLQMANMSFDVFTGDLIRALCSGGKLVICPQEALLSPDKLYRLIHEEKVDCAEFVPVILNNLIEYLDETKQNLHGFHLLAVGSDTWNVSDFRQAKMFCGTGARLLNSYGLTETTIDSSFFEDGTGTLPEEGLVPIGRPFPNTQMFILDPHLQLVPIGIPGEVYVGGAGLSHGYFNRPDLTAERFLPNPFSIEAGSRLYRTGDMARYLPNGNIEFLGRIDHQVKIRGLRIELGEIEAVIRQHESIRNAIVLALEDIRESKQLVAFVIPALDQGPEENELRNLLKSTLPSHMIPVDFVIVETFPVTPNGKIDRRALANLWTEHQKGESLYVAPRTPVEETLAAIWREVLELDQVSIHDNFFELGGHSLLAMKLLSRMQKRLECEIPLRALLEVPSVAGLAAIIEAASQTGETAKQPPLEPVPRGNPLPMSFAQQRLWFLDQIDPGSTAYLLTRVFRLTGTLNYPALEQSLNALVSRHETMRTTFATEDHIPVQVIAPAFFLFLPIIDLQNLSTEEQETAIAQRVQEDALTPFDLSVGPLIRATILQVGPQEHIFLLTLHHIITDGWSMGILFRELAELYQAACDGQPAELPPLAVQYADYSAWQRQWLQGEVLEQQLSYWRNQLSDLPLLDFPTDHPRPPLVTHHGQRHSFTLSSTLLNGIKAVSYQAGTTLFMTLLAGFQVLLARYSGQHDVMVGTPVANRSRQEVEGLIGFFVNTLVLRSDLSGNPPFMQVLHQVQEHCLQAYAHQDIPFEKIVEELQPARDPSRHPLFQIMFQVNQPSADTEPLPGLTSIPVPRGHVQAKFDLAVTLTESPKGLWGTIIFNTDLFEAETMARLSEHFAHLLDAIVQNPNQRVDNLPLLTEPELQQLMVGWNATETVYSNETCIQQLFEAQVERTPEATAVVFGEGQLTYHELNVRANQLAHYLQNHGVGPEACVGVCLERSLEMVVGILGILKAGGVYVPLDPSAPPARLAFILEDTGMAVLLTQAHLRATLPKFAEKILALDAQWDRIAQAAATNLASSVTAENLAYIIYTSGSTGRPKGAMISHGAICNHMQWMRHAFPLTEADCVIQKTPYSFDASVWEFFAPLLAGARLALAGQDSHRDPTYLIKFIAEQDVTVLQIVPTLFRQLLEKELASSVSLQYVFCGGEILPIDLVQQWCNVSSATLVNLYGPTETTIDVLFWVGRLLGDSTIVPVGRPIANIQVYVLDRAMQPVPIGVTGELYIGGCQLARGYLTRPDLTAECFVPHPFSEEPGARLYRTGDHARFRADGNLEFLGRVDHQVKLRGYRIELGEIEAVLTQHPDVQEAVVVVREDGRGNKRLVAYVVPHKSYHPSASELKEFLQEKLPSHMMPTMWVMLEAIPLTPNGKVDRRALPAGENGEVDRPTEYLPSRGPIEEALATIWQEVLGIEQVGVFDNFFDLGGHSLSSIQVISMVEQKIGVRLAFEDLLNQTLGQLAAQCEEKLNQGGTP